MDGTAVIAVIVGGIAVAAAGFVIGRRSLSMSMRSLHEEVKRSSDALVRTRALQRGRPPRAGPDPGNDAGRRAALRRRMANGLRERSARTPPRPGGRPRSRSCTLRPSARWSRRSASIAVPRRSSSNATEPTRWLRATAAPAGSDGSILLVVTDITETRRIEAVRRDFVANASHELKTPAASIQAVAETLASVADHDPAAVPRFASQLEREAMRLSTDRRRSARPVAAGVRQRPGRPDPARRRWSATNSTASRRPAARPG